MYSVVIVCAGSGTRMNSNKNKVLLPLNQMPIFMHSVKKFETFSDDIIVVCKEEDKEEILAYHNNICIGGVTRQESVYNGVMKAKYSHVLIHDGARPFVSNEEIKSLIESSNKDSAFLGLKMVDSIKDITNLTNVNRDNFIIALTPQLVRKDLYLEAYSKALETGVSFTDDVDLINTVLGIKPELILGKKDNIKITTLEDYLSAVKRCNELKIGYSWDVHKLVPDRKLILGGIQIDYDLGLLGHSDADALLHAISESMLGALALGDLGSHFPDNDPKYKNADSKDLLLRVYELVKNEGYRIVNIDTMIYAEKPKMNPHILKMRNVISSLLEIDLSQISIKATTYEKMDAIGRGEAIACDSTILLAKK